MPGRDGLRALAGAAVDRGWTRWTGRFACMFRCIDRVAPELRLFFDAAYLTAQAAAARRAAGRGPA
jgi:hypothetical protein